MPEWSDVGRQHVLAAIAEHDRIGSREFLRRYGFGRARAYALWHGGQEYECPAILGVAYLHATGEAVTSGAFSGGEQEAAAVLKTLGFDVTVDEEAAAAPQPRRAAARPAKRSTPSAKRAASPAKRAAAPAKRAARPEPVIRLCPRCNVAVPASGVCDFCD